MFKKLFFLFERFIFEKGSKFVLISWKILIKDIVVEVEVVIVRFFDDKKDVIRIIIVLFFYRVRLLLYNNIFKVERKVFKSLKEDDFRVIMKVEKGNCFVVMDRIDYDEKMEVLFSD